MPEPWRRTLSLFAMVALVGIGMVALGGGVRAAPGDQCVACHTDPAKLKTLAVEPPISAEEGEG